MNEKSSEVLYYPNFNPKNLPGIKQSLLLYDRVNLIAPLTTPIMGSLLSDSSGTELSQIGHQGALSESWELPSANKVVGLISDMEIIQSRRDEFISALEQDLADESVLSWEKGWKSKHGKKDLNWFVLPSYFGDEIPTIDHPDYQIQPFRHDMFGELLRVPFLVGMSLGLSEALWAAVDKGYTLFTDDDASEQFLMLRLQRGWKRLTQDPKLHKQFGIETEFAKKYAVAYLGARTLQSKVPKLIQKASNMSIAEIIELREKSRHSNALMDFRRGLANLIESQDLWGADKFLDFEHEAFKVYKQCILPAFEELEDRRVPSIKDILVAFDWKNAVKETIKSGPDLFIGAAAASGGALFLGPVAVAPAALIALGCGMSGHFVKNLVEQMSDHLKKRRSAQFLTYPLNLQKVVNEKANS